jgi:predicted amidophosphoribosyltransferase
MRQTCPSCSKTLDIGDEFLGKLVRCPSCTLTFVASAALADAPGQKQPQPVDRSRIQSEGYELDGEADAPPQDTGITEPKFCPNCGKLWPTGKPQCTNCRYDLVLRRVALLERKFRLPKVDMQGVYVLLAVAALAVGGYFLFKNWNAVFSSIDSLWQNKR